MPQKQLISAVVRKTVRKAKNLKQDPEAAFRELKASTFDLDDEIERDLALSIACTAHLTYELEHKDKS